MTTFYHRFCTVTMKYIDAAAFELQTHSSSIRKVTAFSLILDDFQIIPVSRFHKIVSRYPQEHTAFDDCRNSHFTSRHNRKFFRPYGYDDLFPILCRLIEIIHGHVISILKMQGSCIPVFLQLCIEKVGQSNNASRKLDNPINPATKVLKGRLYIFCGVSICWMTPLFMIAMRSDTASASSWSWVTYTVVMWI